MTRREAGVDREYFESFDTWPLAVDEEHGRAVRRRLEQDRAEHASNHRRCSADMITTTATSAGMTTPPEISEPANERASREDVRRSAIHCTGRASRDSNPSSGTIHVVTARPMTVVTAASTR